MDVAIDKNTRWPLVRLGDVCDVIGGGTPSKENKTFYQGNIPWATVRDMRNDFVNTTEHKITEQAVKSSSTNIIPGGNVIIATRVGLGKICILSMDTAINQDLRGIVPKNINTLEVKYLFYWFRSIADEIINEGTGATVQGVKLPFIKGLLIPLPPLAEQQRIVARLDAAFAAIAEASAAAEANLRNARALFDSYLDQVFSTRGAGWVERRLGDVTNFIDYRGKTPEKTSEGIPLITAKNIKMGYLLREPREFIAVTDYSSWMTRGIPRRGDVLFTTEAPLANVAVLDTEELVAFAQRVIILQPNSEELIGTFLMFQLMSSEIQSQIKTFATGATVQGIKASLLRRILINLPSIKQQNQINEQCNESYVTSIELINIYKSKLAALTELKQSLLAEVFGA